jgi:hypothetical protein
MKNTFKKFLAVMVVLTALSPLRASAAVNIYADDIQTNNIATTSETPAATNAPPTNTSRHGRTSSGADYPPVRIDETGVHVGGPNPVDINVPEFARHGRERAMRAFDVEGIVAIVSTFGMPVAIVAIALFFKHRRNKMAHDTLRAMIEKGVPMTPELVAEVRDRGCGSSAGGPARSRLLPGLILAGVGTALLIGGSRGEARGGWIVLFIGIAFLIVWSMERKNQNSAQPPR